LTHTTEEPNAVAAELSALLIRKPKYAARLGIAWTDAGALNPVDLQRAADRFVLVCVQLD
jgi:hypothetical protein